MIPDLSEHLSEQGRLSSVGIELFSSLIKGYFRENRRHFEWRYAPDPYHVFVSEVMLQQTQTDRVAQKFPLFLQAFPCWKSLAAAPLQHVLTVWQGMGYSRRALALHKTAQLIVTNYSGMLPQEEVLLDEFPGIGPATASSIICFAFNKKTIFIETNIRTVFIALFFGQRRDVHDNEIMPLVEQTLDQDDPRSWYYALMDYGVFLKKKIPNPSRRSKHYTKQTPFEGSERQIRGLILKYLAARGKVHFDELCAAIKRPPHRIERNLFALCDEGFIKIEGDFFVM